MTTLENTRHDEREMFISVDSSCKVGRLPPGQQASSDVDEWSTRV